MQVVVLKPIKASYYYVNSTDEYPILFIIAALTKGVSVLKVLSILLIKKVIELRNANVIRQIGKTISLK